MLWIALLTLLSSPNGFAHSCSGELNPQKQNWLPKTIRLFSEEQKEIQVLAGTIADLKGIFSDTETALFDKVLSKLLQFNGDTYVVIVGRFGDQKKFLKSLVARIVAAGFTGQHGPTWIESTGQWSGTRWFSSIKAGIMAFLLENQKTALARLGPLGEKLDADGPLIAVLMRK